MPIPMPVPSPGSTELFQLLLHHHHQLSPSLPITIPINPMATAAPATAATVKLRDPNWCPSTNNDVDADVGAVPTTNGNITSKIGESFLSDIQSVLASPPLPSALPNAAPQSSTVTTTTAPHESKDEDRRADSGFDFSSHSNEHHGNQHKSNDEDSRPDGAFEFPHHSSHAHDNHDSHNHQGTHPNLQSELLFLDQAMQPQPSPVAVSTADSPGIHHDPHHHHRTMNTMNSINAINPINEGEGVGVGGAELDPHDSLFGGNAAAFTQPLFDDHNKLLAFDGPPVAVDPAVVPSTYKTADGGCEATDLGHVLGTLGIPTTTNSSGRCNIGNGGGLTRSLQGYYGQEVPLPGSVAFGRQKKRRLSTMSGGTSEGDSLNIYPDGFEDRIAKRAKSDMNHATAGNLYYGERTGGRALYGMGVGGTGNKINGGGVGKARAYTILNEHHFENANIPRTNTDSYENLSPDLQQRIDALREKIDKMPRRKLRESLAKNVTIDEVEPLMSINRDDLAEMLGLGVTTWKIFVHTSFNLPRWPARVLKSQEMHEKSARMRLHDAKQRGDTHATAEIWQELKKIEDKKYKWRNQLRTAAKRCRDKLMNTFKNQNNNTNSNAASPKE